MGKQTWDEQDRVFTGDKQPRCHCLPSLHHRVAMTPGRRKEVRAVFTTRISGLLQKKQPGSSEEDTKHVKAL